MVMIIFIGMFLEYSLKIFERSENFQRLIPAYKSVIQF